jgi:hypothetical protein
MNSCQGGFSLVMQRGGDLVLIDAAGGSLWDSGTSTVGAFAIMQNDGNFVVYDGNLNPLWASATYGNPGAFLMVQSDGTIAVRSPEGTRVLWSSLPTNQFDVYAGGGVPADPNLSIGPTLVGMVSQLHAYFYTRSGQFDHSFDIPSTDTPCCDSKIVYDPTSGRWFISVLVFPGTNLSGVEFFVSSDASATSFSHSLPIFGDESHTCGSLIDDPNITVTSDKVVVAAAKCLWVFDKSQIISGQALALDPTAKGMQSGDQIWGVKYGGNVPSTAYFIAWSSDDPLNAPNRQSWIDWIAVDGTPANQNVQVHENVVPIALLQPPPRILQPNGKALASGGVLATWDNNRLWWSHTEGCGTNNSYTCARMIGVRTDTGVVGTLEFSMPDAFVWFAAPGLDRSGNMWAIMSTLTAAGAPGLAIGGQLASGAIRAPAPLVPGIAPYGDTHWGDYFSAAQDPVDGTVWTIGMYGAATNYGGKIVHVQAR